MDWPVTYRRKVRFSDTDAQGIVFNGNYLTYFDDTMTDYFDALGIPWSSFVERGYEMVLGRVEVDFRSSARVGDVLVTGARCVEVGRTSLIFDLETWEDSSGRTVVRGREIQVIVDAKDFSKRPIPEFLLDSIAKLQGEPVRERSAS